MTGSLAGTVALVTGGASGIGKATADLFTERGATAVVADRTPSPGGLVVDVSDSAAVDRMVADVVQRHGKIDILVHAPAILKIVPIVETSDEDWKRIIDVNLNGTFYTSRAVARAMIRATPAGSSSSPRAAARRARRAMPPTPRRKAG